LTPPVDVVDGVCALPSSAQAYVFNATVVPSGYLGYLRLWPDSENQPVVSTPNAPTDGSPRTWPSCLSVNCKIDGLAQMILDISVYFAP